MKRFFTFLLSLFSLIAGAQNNRYNPTLEVQNLEIHLKNTRQFPDMDMVELKSIVPHVRYDLKYATKENFTGKRMYPPETRESFLRQPVASALGQIAKELEANGLGIWVWDAYRPYHVTVAFWELIHDDRYVAHPGKGSGHNRGIAIDMTLYELANGRLLDMPTGFDDFSEKAHHGNASSTPSQIKNRELLKGIMEKYGFKSFETEWWHYYWRDSDRFGVLDIPFKSLKKN